MTDNKQKPKLRNKGYDGEWVRQILGDICKRYDNLRIPVTSTSRILGNIPYYGANGIQDYVSDYTHNGEYILIAEDGANNLIDYPVRYVNGKFWANNHVHVISAIDGISSNKFLTYAIPKSDIKPHLVGGDRSKLTSEALMKLDIYKPTSIKEQEYIGNLFIHIDDYLEKEASYTTKLEASKKSLLQKMFPEGNNDKPSLRFKGFTDPWEQEKLGKALFYEQPTKYIVTSNKYNDSGRIPVLTAGQTLLLGFTDEQFSIKEASHNNPVIIFDDFTTSSHYIDFKFKIKSSAMKLLSTEPNIFNSYFCYCILQNINYIPTTHNRHWISIFSDMVEMFPNIEEQNKIAKILMNIDSLITLHQRKYEKLQNIKKSLLERMFI